MEPDPLFETPMGSTATATHETFLSYVQAGFTENQALKLIAYVLVFGINHEASED